MLTDLLNILTVLLLLPGFAFLLLGALGILRLNDTYNRMHAASKSVTLGISFMLLAAIVFAAIPDPPGVQGDPKGSLLSVATKSALVILFQFIAAPVGTHMLAKAAHKDGVPQSPATLGDDLAEDESKA